MVACTCVCVWGCVRECEGVRRQIYWKTNSWQQNFNFKGTVQIFTYLLLTCASIEALVAFFNPHNRSWVLQKERHSVPWKAMVAKDSNIEIKTDKNFGVIQVSGRWHSSMSYYTDVNTTYLAKLSTVYSVLGWQHTGSMELVMFSFDILSFHWVELLPFVKLKISCVD